MTASFFTRNAYIEDLLIKVCLIRGGFQAISLCGEIRFFHTCEIVIVGPAPIFVLRRGLKELFPFLVEVAVEVVVHSVVARDLEAQANLGVFVVLLLRRATVANDDFANVGGLSDAYWYGLCVGGSLLWLGPRCKGG